MVLGILCGVLVGCMLAILSDRIDPSFDPEFYRWLYLACGSAGGVIGALSQ